MLLLVKNTSGVWGLAPKRVTPQAAQDVGGPKSHA